MKGKGTTPTGKRRSNGFVTLETPKIRVSVWCPFNPPTPKEHNMSTRLAKSRVSILRPGPFPGCFHRNQEDNPTILTEQMAICFFGEPFSDFFVHRYSNCFWWDDVEPTRTGPILDHRAHVVADVPRHGILPFDVPP